MAVELTEKTMPILNVPYKSQQDNKTSQKYGRKGCGLTSLRMVLEFWGGDLSLKQLEELIEKTNSYSEAAGWVHEGMVNIARGLGLQGYRINYQFLEDDDIKRAELIFKKEGALDYEINQFKESVLFAKNHTPNEDLKRLIDNGIPIITSMETAYAKTLATHMIVPIGYDSTSFVVNDPWTFGPKHKVDLEEFENHWTKRAIVIYRK